MTMKSFRRRPGNAASGLEYNDIITGYRVSSYIYSVDIARNPQVVKGFGTSDIDVHAKAEYANRYQFMINSNRYRCRGSGGE